MTQKISPAVAASAFLIAAETRALSVSSITRSSPTSRRAAAAERTAATAESATARPRSAAARSAPAARGKHHEENLKNDLANKARHQGAEDEEPDTGENQGSDRPAAAALVRIGCDALHGPLLPLGGVAGQYLHDVFDAALDAAGIIAGLEAWN